MTTTGPEVSPVDPTGAYAVKLPIFEGPLDLLLHLIRMNEVDVTDIPIARIAEQYVETIELMQELNLDVAGEYLVMAATLAWIKSRMILPPVPGDEDEEEVDPRAELIARLLEYQRFKEVAEGLDDRHRLDRDVFRPDPPDPEPVPEGEREIEVTLVALLEAFRSVLRSARTGPGVHEVEAETVTVRERMVALMEQLAEAGHLEFEQVFACEGTPRPSRAVLVTTFLAVLELVRLAALRIYQGLDEAGVPRGPIHLRCTDDSAADWRERIADVM